MTTLAKQDLKQQLAAVMANLELIGDLIDDGEVKTALALYRNNVPIHRNLGVMMSLYPYESHVSLKVGGTA